MLKAAETVKVSTVFVLIVLSLINIGIDDVYPDSNLTFFPAYLLIAQVFEVSFNVVEDCAPVAVPYPDVAKTPVSSAPKALASYIIYDYVCGEVHG